MKTFCIFSAFYLPHLGGVEQYTHHLAQQLIEAGHHVVIVTSQIVELELDEYKDGLRIIRIPGKMLMNDRYPLPYIGKAYKSMLEKLKEISIDAIIVQSRFYLLSAIGIWYANRNNIPMICIEHGTSHLSYGNVFIDRAIRIYEHVITSCEKQLCHSFYGVSKEAAQWLEHYGIQAKGVLYNSVDIKQIDRLLSDPIVDFKKTYHLDKDAILITYTGRLIPEKGIMRLIQAVEAIADKHPQIVLMIAGDGPLLEDIKKHNGKHVVVLGRRSFGEIVALLGQSEVFCLPTAYPEGFPTSTLEAMACGCYPIVTNRGGSRELIINSEYGCVIENNEVETLIKAIDAVLLDKQHRSEVKKNAQLRVSQHFSWEKTCKRLLEIEWENLK